MAPNIKDPEVMREISKMALETAMQYIAGEAEKFATDPLMLRVNGRDALLSFARAMRKTNAQVWPIGETRT